MKQKINVAVIGYGFSATTFHIPFIQTVPGFKLAAINSRRSEEVHQKHPEVTVCSTVEEVGMLEGIDLVIITTPNHLHYAQAGALLKAGKHVVVEKPFVINSQEGKTLIQLAEANNVTLSVYHNRRWDGDFLTIKQLIDKNTLGSIRYFESHFDRFRPEVRQRWREQAGNGSGILWDLAPHLIDQSLQLFGLPESLTATIKALRSGAVTDDYFHLQLHYAQHEVVLHSSPFMAAPNPRFILQGDQGSYVKYGLDPQEDALREGITPNHPDWGQEDASHYGTLYQDERSASSLTTCQGDYNQFFLKLHEAIFSKAPTPVTACSALPVIQLIEYAQISAKEGGTLRCEDIQ